MRIRTAFYKRLIGSAVRDAKEKGRDAAIARAWIDRRIPYRCVDDEERSFVFACEQLGLDPAAERERLLIEIDRALEERGMTSAGSRSVMYGATLSITFQISSLTSFISSVSTRNRRCAAASASKASLATFESMGIHATPGRR